MTAVTPGRTETAHQGFSIVPRWVWTGHRPREIQIYAALAGYVDWKTGVCWPSRQTIATELDCSLDTVDRAMKALEASGAVQVRRRKKEAGHNDTNVYQLPFAINRRAAVENAPRGSRKTAAPPPQKRGSGSRKTAAQNKNQEQEWVTDPSPTRNNPETCPHRATDTEGYCAACGTDLVEAGLIAMAEAVVGSGPDDT